MLNGDGGMGGFVRSLNRFRWPRLLSRGIKSLFETLTDKQKPSDMGGMGGEDREHGRDASPIFLKDDPIVRLGKSKFPDLHAKHAWLLLFYDEDAARLDPTTQHHVALAKKLSEDVLRKANNVKNEMMFKVGAVNCSGENLPFCMAKNDYDFGTPTFATVLNGSVTAVTSGHALKNDKTLYDHTTTALLNIDGLIVSINSVRDIQTRLFGSSAVSGHPAIAILLLMDTRGTSPLYASLAYRHRMDGFAAFGESRGSNSQLSKKLSVKKYPTLIALVGVEATGRSRTHQEVSRYDGEAMDSSSLSKWGDGLSRKHFK